MVLLAFGLLLPAVSAVASGSLFGRHLRNSANFKHDIPGLDVHMRTVPTSEDMRALEAFEEANEAYKPYLDAIRGAPVTAKRYSDQGIYLKAQAMALGKESSDEASVANQLPRATSAQMNAAQAAIFDAREKAKQAQTMALDSKQYFAAAAEVRKGIPEYQYDGMAVLPQIPAKPLGLLAKRQDPVPEQLITAADAHAEAAAAIKEAAVALKDTAISLKTTMNGVAKASEEEDKLKKAVKLHIDESNEELEKLEKSLAPAKTLRDMVEKAGAPPMQAPPAPPAVASPPPMASAASPAASALPVLVMPPPPVQPAAMAPAAAPAASPAA